jgi:DNA topoisomerase-1
MASFLIKMYNTFGYSNQRASMVSQKLYEKGLISYPRTDSKRISSESFVQAIEEFIGQKYGSGLYQTPVYKKAKQSQDAHEAIRPTDITLTPEQTGLKGMELRGYQLV